MSAYRVTAEERQLLVEVLERHQPLLKRLLDDALGGRKLTAADANLLRDAIGDELAATGVDSDTGAVNERGRRLDDLIDLVAELSVLHDP